MRQTRQMDVGERMMIPCRGGPVGWRAARFPPPLEIELGDGLYVLDQEIGPIEARVDGSMARPLDRDAALVTYRSDQQRGSGHRSSVWLRCNGRWLLEFHQGTPTV